MKSENLLVLVGVPIAAASLLIFHQSVWSLGPLMTGVLGGFLIRRRIKVVPYAALSTSPYLALLLLRLSEPKALLLAELISDVVGIQVWALVMIPVVIYFLTVFATSISIISILGLLFRRKR
ncbi:MAG: hypothetical protein NZ988_03190 [Thaumarchaeota archaeon]|nr:hypothetical protein [Candidatus Calditenuaceae archaeon]MDW8187036.1 hypothetical protein [Nitrososphaerota archaeon]